MSLASGPTSTHLFCGAGGDTEGLREAGFVPVTAANHSAVAIETHAANFPDTEHLCVNIDHYDMRRLPKTQVLWGSPICQESSPAGGRKRRRVANHDQLDLFDEGPVDDATWERTRATAYDILRAVEIHGYDAVLCENVVEFGTDWPLFRWWLQAMEILGYNHQIVCVSAAHIGDDTNAYAPQWRDRIFVVFVKKTIRKPDLKPRPAAWCPMCGERVAAVQSWKNPRAMKIGKYRQQYVYRCPNRRCRHAVVEPYVLPAAAAIDWSHIGQRIGDRKRPLAPATLRRIQAGLEMFGRPAIVNSNHDDDRTYPADAAPLSGRTTKIGDGLATPPFITMLRGNANARGVDEPLNAVMSGRNHMLVEPAPFITVLRRNCTAEPISDPLNTVAAGGNHLYLTVPDAFYVKNYGGNARPGDMVKRVDQPLGAVTTKDHHALVIPYYRTGKPKTTGQPLDTVTVKDRFGLLSTAVEIDDCHYRMLQPREHMRAQRFPDVFVVKGNKGEQTAQAGNAVPVNVARWIGEGVYAVLDGGAA
jgi:DNA (cytosine-5)-methyltransferase 1